MVKKQLGKSWVNGFFIKVSSLLYGINFYPFLNKMSKIYLYSIKKSIKSIIYTTKTICIKRYFPIFVMHYYGKRNTSSSKKFSNRV